MSDNLHDQIRAAITPMEGWCWPEKALALADLILSTQPQIVVEIGVFGGRSLIPQAMALRTNGAGMIYGIDPWKLEAALEGENGPESEAWWRNNVNLHDIHRKCVEEIWRHGLDDWCVLLRCPSQRAVTLFPSIDILHLDGNHSELASCRDVELYLPRIKHGGHVWMDDTDWQTTQRAVGLLEESTERIASVGACRLYRKR